MFAVREYGQLESHLDDLVAKGKYSFTSNDIKTKFGITHNAFQKQVSILSEQRKVALIRKGFYAIVPPEYRRNSAPPIVYYIDSLMEGLKRPYYIGLLNAAAWYGAAHQQPQKHIVVTSPPVLPPIKKKYARIDFVYKTEWQEIDILKQKTNAGYVNISSPELTALDLCYYSKHAGGINQVATVLDELAEELKPDKLLDISKRFNSTKAVQRLGFLLEFLGNEELIFPLKNWLATQKFYPTILDPAEQSHNKVTGNFWKIIVNIDIETDL